MKFELEDFSPESICAAIEKEWHFRVHPDEMIWPTQGKDSVVVFARELVIKFLKITNAIENPLYRGMEPFNRFRKEVETLQSVKDTDLGVEKPRIVLVGKNIAMFSMTPVNDGPMLEDLLGPEKKIDDWIIKKLARFMVKFDQAMKKPEPAILEPPLPASENVLRYVAKSELAPLLKAAEQEIGRPSPFPQRFVHGDLKPNNIFVNPAEKSLSVIDFGWAGSNDPHKQIAAMLLFYEINAQSCAHLIDEVNRTSTNGRWMSMRRVSALAARQLAEGARQFDQLSPNGRGNRWFENSLKRIQSGFQLSKK